MSIIMDDYQRRLHALDHLTEEIMSAIGKVGDLDPAECDSLPSIHEDVDGLASTAAGVLARVRAVLESATEIMRIGAIEEAVHDRYRQDPSLAAWTTRDIDDTTYRIASTGIRDGDSVRVTRTSWDPSVPPERTYYRWRLGTLQSLAGTTQAGGER